VAALRALRRHSMRTTTETAAGRTRYALLEMVRDYARSKLDEEPAEARSAAERHAGHYLQFAEERVARMRTRDEARALDELSEELDNLRAAMDGAQQRRQGEFCARLALALYEPLHRRGFWEEARWRLQAGWAATAPAEGGGGASSTAERSATRAGPAGENAEEEMLTLQGSPVPLSAHSRRSLGLCGVIVRAGQSARMDRGDPRLRSLPLAVMFALLLLGGAPEAQAIQLRYKFRKGDVSTYRTMVAAAGRSETPFTPAAMKMQMTVDVLSTQRVLSVAPNGTAQIESKNLSGTMRMTNSGKTETSKVPPERTIYTLTDRGRLLRYRDLATNGKAGDATSERSAPGGSAADGAATGLENTDQLKALYGLNFPARDLKPGDTWNAESKVDIGSGQSVLVKIASRFLALTSFQGRRCAKILTAFEMPMAPPGGAGEAEGVSMTSDGKVTGQITSFFDIAEGREVYTDGSVAMLMKMQMSAPLDPSGAVQTVEMNTVFKMNLRQVLVP
jgi:hypothetical protein